jgi:hypothetical protein
MEEIVQIEFCFYGYRKYGKSKNSLFNLKYEQFFCTNCTINDINKMLEYIKMFNSLNINENKFEYIIRESSEPRLKYVIDENNEIVIIDLSFDPDLIENLDFPALNNVRRQTNWNPTLIFYDVETFLVDIGFCTKENIYHIKNRIHDKYKMLWLASNTTNIKNILFKISPDVVRLCTEFI